MSMPITNPPIGPAFEPSPSPEPLFGPDPNVDTSSSGSALDTIIQIPGGKTIVLTDAPITIGQFADAVYLSLNSSKQMINLSNLTDLITNGRIGTSQGDLAQALAQIQAQITFLQNQEETLFTTQNSEISAENGAINSLNSAVTSNQLQNQAQIDTMNAAITNYNAGKISDQQFNTIAAAYNTYAQANNLALQPFIENYETAYNNFQQQVGQNNTSTNAINALLTLYGIPSISQQTDLPTNPPTATLMAIQQLAPLTKPVSLLPSPQTIPNLQTIFPPPLNPIDFLTNYFEPLAKQLETVIALSNRRLNIHTAFTDYLLFYLPGKHVTAPPSIVDVPSVFLDTNNNNGSGGVAIPSLSPNFIKAGINGILAVGITESNQKQFQLQFNLRPLNQFVQFISQLSSFAGLQAAVEAMRLLGTHNLANSNSVAAFGVAFAVSNAQIIAQEISNGNLKNFIQQGIIRELGNQVDQNTISRLTDFIHANLNLSLLQTALLTASNSLGTPGLISQTLGNVNGISLSALAQSSQTFERVTQNNLTQLALKSFLSSQLAQSEAINNQSQADQIANSSIQNVLAQNSVQNAQDFAAVLTQQLIAQNIAFDIAEQTARLTTRLLEEESKAQAILNENLLNQSKAQEVLASQIAQQAKLNDQEAQILAQKAIYQAFQNHLISNTAEFQFALENELTQAGIKEEDARRTLEQTVSSLNAPLFASPLLNPVPNLVLSRVELGNNLHGFIQNQLNGLTDEERARQIANQAVEIFIGSSAPSQSGQTPSILALINENAQIIQRIGGPHGVNLVAENFRNFLSPDIDLLAFSREIMDPAYNLFFSASTGIMYAGKPHPSNFKQELDIRV